MLKNIIEGHKVLFRFIFCLTASIIITVAAFVYYLSQNSLNLQIVIDYLKQHKIVKESTTIDRLELSYNSGFIITAKNININAENINIALNNARIEFSNTNLIMGKLIAKELELENADINVNLDNIIASSNSTKSDSTESSNSSIKSYLEKSAKWIKFAHIDDSKINITYKNEVQELKDLNLRFYNTKNTTNFNASAKYLINNKVANITSDISYLDENDINLEVKIENIATNEFIKNFVDSNIVEIAGTSNLNINAKLNSKNQIYGINGNAQINNGFVKVNNVYNNKIEFKEISANLNYNIKENNLIIESGVIVDANNNNFKANASINNIFNPAADINLTIDKISYKSLLTYLPDYSYKDWITENFKSASFNNVSFNYSGKFTGSLNGEGDNPFLNISSDFNNLEMSYLEELPNIKNASGKFNLFKNEINISVDNGAVSKQNISRASINISPIFNQEMPAITIKTISNGQVDDVLNVLNKKLNLEMQDLFKHYSGQNETQATLVLDLNKIDTLDNDKQEFISVDVIADLKNIKGVEPAFNQQFVAEEATVKLTENSFILNANGSIDENSFNIKMEEDLMEFGKNSKIVVNGTFDSYILKEYTDISGFKLTGLLNGVIKLNKNDNTWNFDIDTNLDDSLINIELLNYTKMLKDKANLVTSGYFDMQNNKLHLNNTKLNFSNLKGDVEADINLNEILTSKIIVNNLIVKDTTKLKEFSLKDKSIKINGEMLDIRPFNLLDKDKSTEKSNIPTKINLNKYINTINANVKKLLLDDKAGELYNAKVELDFTNKLTGIIRTQSSLESQDFYVKLIQDENNKNNVVIESIIPNIGGYLQKLDLYDNINNGHTVTSGNILFNDDNTINEANINIDITKFELLKAPLLAKALASISLEQLFSDKKGILFDNLNARMFFKDNIVKFEKIKIKGPSLGLVFTGAYDLQTKTTDIKGTLVPVVKINSFIDNIPVLGYILTGSQGAISGADFSIKGTKGKHKVNVAPLSLITPGIVKDLFESVSSIVTEDDSKELKTKAIKKARKKAEKEESNN